MVKTGFLFLVFLLLSAFFSASETALTTLNRDRLLFLSRKGSKRAKNLAAFVAHPGDFLATILIGNTLVNAALAALATILTDTLLGDLKGSLALSTLSVTLVILIFGEITPKTVAALNGERLSFLFFPFLKFCHILFRPLGRLLTSFSNFFLRRTKGGTKVEPPKLNEDLLTYLVESKKVELESEEKERLYLRFFSFSRKRVKEAMVQRTRTITLPLDCKRDEVLEVMRRHGFSRYPVYRRDPDDIVGILLTRHYLQASLEGGVESLEGYVHKPLFLPESTLLPHALERIRTERSHLAVVVDEFGSFEGIVTLEDILEELTGEISDEKDPGMRPLLRKEKKRWVLPGDFGTAAFYLEVAGRAPEEESEDFVTLAGFLLDRLGHIPEVGEEVREKGFRFSVLEMERQTIKSILVEMDNEDSCDQ